jgi:two-component system OmpR family sensor kinase
VSRPAGSRVPLRFSLVALVVGLVGVGLLVSGLALTTAMRDRLISREDQALHQAADSWARPSRQMWQPPPSGARRPPTRFYVATFLPDGTELRASNPDFNARPNLTGLKDVGDGATTVRSVGDGPEWRVVQSRSDYGVSYVAVALNDVDDTMQQLVMLELGFGLLVVLIAGGVGYLLVRRSLRPLEEVEAIAEAIAVGDLTRRIPPAPPHTEVGRLGTSLNSMLHQIQDSFAQVEASEERARRGEERMRRFVGDASHELRTPLTSIRGFAELYRQGATGDTDFLMNHIESEAKRMSVLVEDLLLLARLDAARPWEPTPVDLVSVAADVVDAAHVREPERTLELEVTEAATDITVPGDRNKLVQVLTNLVSNALRHTPAAADITVRIDAEPQAAVISVIDTGLGMTEDEAGQVFERFYRTDSSRSRGSGGSGLGLSIVAGIVAAHGGNVELKTAPDAGATFIVRLPRQPWSAADTSPLPMPTIRSTATGSPSTGDGERRGNKRTATPAPQ